MQNSNQTNVDMGDSKYLVTKALICSYRYLNAYSKVLKTTLKKLAMSGFESRHMREGLTTEKLIERISRINYRLAGLVNIKVLVDDALNNIASEYTDIIVARHFRNKSTEVIAKELEVSERTYFRKYNTAIKKVQEYLDKIGYTEEKIKQEYSDEQLIIRMMDYLKKSNGKMYTDPIQD